MARPNQPAPADSRQVALDLLDAVLLKRRALDAAISSHSGFGGLSARDRAFARLLAATVLRRLGEVDAALAPLLERPLAPGAARVMNALRIGAAQRLFLDTPPHAAVDTTVRLLDGRLSGFKGLANAVLRKVAAPAETLDAARLDTPDWLWRSWVSAHGKEAAAGIAAAHLAEPPLDLTVARDAETWRERLQATLLPTGSLRRPIGGDPSALPGYDEGAWWVQDAAAALPARLLGPIAGRRVIDLCAAPGGKTAQLAAAGAEVTAVDRSPARLARLGENLRRLRLDAQVVEADAATWRPDRPADAVLLDAPCTATGTIRRHPDIARIKTPGDVARMPAVQDRLLRAAVEMTAPGGCLVYATCSLQPEEGPDRIAALLREGAPVRLDGISATELPGLSSAIRPDGTVRTLPCHWKEFGGIDGFFIARLQRV
ncbi:MAG: methyltransferase domain-containing protein [Alphaproteobacteria bacterium]|nr:methyltransferase domain-containing protein [Alphaproteobacteria bacterium]